jgi:predicted small secreted protein
MRRVVPAIFLACACLLAACSSGPKEEVQLGGISLLEVFDGLAIRTDQMLKGLSQGGSAADARSEIQSINDGYDDLIFHAWKLPPKGQSELAKRATRQLPTVERLVYMTEGSPLEATLLTDLEAMRDKVGTLMVTPYKQPE